MAKKIRESNTTNKLPMLEESLVVSAISMGLTHKEIIGYVKHISGRKIKNATINRVKKDKDAEIKRFREEFIGKEIGEITEKMNIVLGAITEDKAENAKVHQLASAFSTLFDKRRLAAGESTENVAYQGLEIQKNLDDMSEEELEEAIAERATSTVVQTNKKEREKKRDIKRIKGSKGLAK